MSRHRSHRICVDIIPLEERYVPAVIWPFAGGPATNPIVGTYGQYQDNKTPDWDTSVHFHEGLDIASKNRNASGEEVRAVADGEVVERFNNPGDPFRSLVVVQDPSPSTKKWTYKHVVPDLAIRVGKKVKAGDVIGKVAKNGDIANRAGYPVHVHLDRGTGDDPSMGAGESMKKVTPPPTLNQGQL